MIFGVPSSAISSGVYQFQSHQGSMEQKDRFSDELFSLKASPASLKHNTKSEYWIQGPIQKLFYLRRILLRDFFFHRLNVCLIWIRMEGKKNKWLSATKVCWFLFWVPVCFVDTGIFLIFRVCMLHFRWMQISSSIVSCQKCHYHCLNHVSLKISPANSSMSRLLLERDVRPHFPWSWQSEISYS